MDAVNQRPTSTQQTTTPLEQEAQAIIAGLREPQKNLNPKYFYDQQGSALFEQITRLPEYYPTRTEIAILQQQASVIAQWLGKSIHLLEPGAGNCEKVRYLLNDLRPERYVPMDISTEFLQEAAQQLSAQFPWLQIDPKTLDFSQGLQLPDTPAPYRPVVFYPGSTIGNFEPSQAVAFLQQVAEQIRPAGGLLLGVDLQKDPTLLHAAYNDSQGITAEFNRNALSHLNQRVNANFDPADFDHQAFYNSDRHRIEMHLRCRRDHQITVMDQTIDFRCGETIHTENSYKYTLENIADMAEQAGLQLRQSWTDEEQLFSINYLSPPY